MKRLVVAAQQPRPTIAPVGLLLVVTLAVTFWFATTPASVAQGDCTLCHKLTDTLTFTCGSKDYYRHIGHGDTMGPCAVTQTQNP